MVDEQAPVTPMQGQAAGMRILRKEFVRRMAMMKVTTLECW